MKNQYFGDVNDYLKYGLLRCFAAAALRIGMCWMLTANDERSDGSKVKYLSNPEQWRRYDPNLFDDLAKAIQKRARHVRHAQRPTFLADASFFNDLVPDDEQLREIWLTKALTKLNGVDVLFFDPDNGIEVQSKPRGRTGSCKYLFWDEIQRAWSQDSSLLIFQHFPRQNHERYISRLVTDLARYVPGADVIPLITSNVVYLLARQPRHYVKTDTALEAISRKWAGLVGNLAKRQS